MRTYYRGPDAVITDIHFVRQAPTVRTFAIADLGDVRLVRSAARGPSGAVVVLGFGLFAVAAVTGLKFGLAAALPPAVVAVLTPILGLLRRRGRTCEIRARYRAQEVTLYASDDPRVFNQVTRALRRSIEHRHHQTYGLAGG